MPLLSQSDFSSDIILACIFLLGKKSRKMAARARTREKALERDMDRRNGANLLRDSTFFELPVEVSACRSHEVSVPLSGLDFPIQPSFASRVRGMAWISKNRYLASLFVSLSLTSFA